MASNYPPGVTGSEPQITGDGYEPRTRMGARVAATFLGVGAQPAGPCPLSKKEHYGDIIETAIGTAYGECEECGREVRLSGNCNAYWYEVAPDERLPSDQPWRYWAHNYPAPAAGREEGVMATGDALG